MSTEQVNLEVLVAACVANAVACGFHSATVALVRGAAQMARAKGATREQFVEAAGKAFDAVGDIAGLVARIEELTKGGAP